MKTGLRRHLTPGNAVAMAALLVALGGTAVAAFPNGSVTTATLANGSVTTAKIRNGAVTKPKIASGAVNADRIAVGAVQAAKIANSAVKSGKIQNSAVTSAKVADGSLTSSDFVPGVLGGLSASKVSVVRDVVSLAAGAHPGRDRDLPRRPAGDLGGVHRHGEQSGPFDRTHVERAGLVGHGHGRRWGRCPSSPSRCAWPRSRSPALSAHETGRPDAAGCGFVPHPASLRLGSHAERESGREDLNLRPPGPQPGALPGCATPRGPLDLISGR